MNNIISTTVSYQTDPEAAPTFATIDGWTPTYLTNQNSDDFDFVVNINPRLFNGTLSYPNYLYIPETDKQGNTTYYLQLNLTQDLINNGYTGFANGVRLALENDAVFQNNITNQEINYTIENNIMEEEEDFDIEGVINDDEITPTPSNSKAIVLKNKAGQNVNKPIYSGTIVNKLPLIENYFAATTITQNGESVFTINVLNPNDPMYTLPQYQNTKWLGIQGLELAINVNVPTQTNNYTQPTITQNGTYTIPNGYTGLNSVTVNVQNPNILTRYIQIEYENENGNYVYSGDISLTSDPYGYLVDNYGTDIPPTFNWFLIVGLLNDKSSWAFSILHNYSGPISGTKGFFIKASNWGTCYVYPLSISSRDITGFGNLNEDNVNWGKSGFHIKLLDNSRNELCHPFMTYQPFFWATGDPIWDTYSVTSATASWNTFGEKLVQINGFGHNGY